MTQPVLYLPHGGGPLPLLDEPGHASLRAFLQQVPALLGKPQAILVISAHWEEARPAVTGADRPPLVYDYYGFPPEAYDIRYPAPGAVAVAERIRTLLAEAGMACDWRDDRGYDHGLFVPLKLMYPEADIPCVQLSLLASLDPREHLRLGELLAPLRKEGVLIIGSGLSFHNMRAYGRNDPKIIGASREFDEWLGAVCTAEDITPASRREALALWQKAPQARFCHPREEHLLPLHVCAGAAGHGPAQRVYHDLFLGTWVSALLWQ